jgi:hypothetical protein
VVARKLSKKGGNGGVRPVETLGLASLRAQDLRRKEQGSGGDINYLHMARYQRPVRLEAKHPSSRGGTPLVTLSLELLIRENIADSFTTS